MQDLVPLETRLEVRMHACGDAQETQCRGGYERLCIMVWETKLHWVASDWVSYSAEHYR